MDSFSVRVTGLVLVRLLMRNNRKNMDSKRTGHGFDSCTAHKGNTSSEKGTRKHTIKSTSPSRKSENCLVFLLHFNASILL